MRVLLRWVLSLFPRSFSSANTAQLGSWWSLGLERAECSPRCSTDNPCSNFSLPATKAPGRLLFSSFRLWAHNFSRCSGKLTPLPRLLPAYIVGCGLLNHGFLINMIMSDFYVLETYESHQFPNICPCPHPLLKSAGIMWCCHFQRFWRREGSGKMLNLPSRHLSSLVVSKYQIQTAVTVLVVMCLCAGSLFLDKMRAIPPLNCLSLATVF